MKIQEVRARYRRELQKYIRTVQKGEETDLSRARALSALYGTLLGYFNAEEAGEIAARVEAIEEQIERLNGGKHDAEHSGEIDETA